MIVLNIGLVFGFCDVSFDIFKTIICKAKMTQTSTNIQNGISLPNY